MPEPSPFAILERTFELLGGQPRPLVIEGWRLGAASSASRIPISELRSLVLDPQTPRELRRGIIDAVIDRLQHQRDPWVVVLGGLLLPGMRRLAGQVELASSQAPAVHSEVEVLLRFLIATHRCPHDTRRFALQLLDLAIG
jgi:hypothetical protein